MNLLHRINRRIKVNRAVRELSRLNHAILLDLGFDRKNMVSMVEDMIDSGPVDTAKA